MSCDCAIDATDASRKGVLRKLLVLNGIMFVAELIVGIIGESTGVIVDSLDMLANAFVYSVALYAVGCVSSIKIQVAFLSGGIHILRPPSPRNALESTDITFTNRSLKFFSRVWVNCGV